MLIQDKGVATETADRILDLAEQLVQARGFNGFSYADIAVQIGITKASLHYHFPSKADLGRRLIGRYHERFMQRLRAIDENGGDALDRLRRYVGIYVGVFRDDRMCLCGMLAADFVTLPEPMKQEVGAFFEANEKWLAGVLAAGRKAKLLGFAGSAAARAGLLVSTLEGAMLVMRSRGDIGRFEQMAAQLVTDLAAAR